MCACIDFTINAASSAALSTLDIGSLSSTSLTICVKIDCNSASSLDEIAFKTPAFSSEISSAPPANATVSAYSMSLIMLPEPSIASTYST